MSEDNEKVTSVLVDENRDVTQVEEVPAKQPVQVEAVPASEAGGETVTLTLAELQKLINSSKGDSIENLARVLADALIESKKPYVDPLQKQNEAAMRQSMRDQAARHKAAVEASQEICPHLQGCNALSEFPGQLTSIVQHRLDTGEIIGLCTNCQRIFRVGDPDYATQMRRKSGNKLSAAGQRFFIDPMAAIQAGR